MKWKTTVLSLTIVAGLAAVSPLHLRAQSSAQNVSARTLFTEGQELWDQGNFVDAGKKFREVLAKYPKAEQSDRTSYYLIKTLIKLGQTNDARVEIDNFYRNYPQSSYKSDVDEERLPLLGPRGPFGAHFPPHTPGLVVARSRPATASGIIASPPNPNPMVSNPFPQEITISLSPELEQEVLRLAIRTDVSKGISLSKERLKLNPVDPAVIANFGTIATAGAAQAVPFFFIVASNNATTPNIKAQALFWINRVDKDAVPKAITEMTRENDAIPALADTLSRFDPADCQNALDQIAKTPGPERMVTLGKIYKGSTNTTLRSQIVQSVSYVRDPAALPFLADVARNEKEMALRVTAVRVLNERKDVDDKTLADILKSIPMIPARAGALNSSSTNPSAPQPASPERRGRR